MRTISKRMVEALPTGKDTVYWDSELKGFGVRVYPSGAKVYVVQSRGRAGRSALRSAGTVSSRPTRRGGGRR